jgi:glycogen(starch) synthase
MVPEHLLTPRAGTRGRIVMLVDNTVHADSRVQKEAGSAADAGWDVVLLGKSADKAQHTWAIGGATVLLVPVPNPLAQRRHELRRAPLRRPLAYPYGLARIRRQQMRAWHADLTVRRARLSAELVAGRSSRSVRLARARLLPALLGWSIASRWVGLRARHSRSFRESQRSMDGLVDRFTTAFWRALMGDRAWRRLDPHLWDYELAFGQVIDKLRPDLIHANDFRMLGVGARATFRARGQKQQVFLVWDAHEFLPGIKPWVAHPRWHLAQCAHEREYAGVADAVVTVSETLAGMLVEEHGLTKRPTVVLNTPDAQTASPDPTRPVPDLRALCGIGADVPLLVFSGAAAPQRGLGIMVEALVALDGVHVALVVLRAGSTEISPYVQELVSRAAELGVTDRVHVLPYVPHDQVVPFLSPADIGVIPIHHWPNHEIALITKFFEYSHARLPIVVSDVKTMADMTRKTGQGEVFVASDLDDYVRAVKSILADPRRYRAAYDAPGLLDVWTWEAQAEALDRVYTDLLPDQPPAPARAQQPTSTPEGSRTPPVRTSA